jgi:hypothetical protein
VELPAFQRLLRNIADTEDEEISCTECLDLVPEFVDLEVAGPTSDRTLPRLQQHLRQCGICHEEYEALRDLVLDADGRPPGSD